MNDVSSFAIIFLYIFLVLFLMLVAGYLLLRRLEDKKSLFYSIGLLFQISWIFSYVIAAYSPEIPDKVFLDTLIITSLVGILVCYLLFSLEYNGIKFANHKVLFYTIIGIAIFLTIPIFIFQDNLAFRYNYEVFVINDDLSVLLNDTGWYLDSYLGLSFAAACVPIGLFTRNLLLKSRSSLIKKQSTMIIASFLLITFQFVIFVWSNAFGLIEYLVYVNLGIFTLANILIFIAVFPLRTFEVLPTANKIILDNIGEGFCIFSKFGDLLEINLELMRILGIVDKGEAIGKSPEILFMQSPTLISLSNSKGIAFSEIALGDSHFEVKKVDFYRRKKNFIGYILIFHDMTVRKEHERNLKASKDDLEQKFHHAQKLESIGQLAGGIAHEFNNILTIILGNTELMQLKDQRDPEDIIYLEEIADAATTASRLTKQLLAIGRKNIIHPQIIDFNQRLNEMKKLFHRLIGSDSDIAIQLELSSHCGTIFADPGLLEQILINLVVNARDAMPTGGILKISTEPIYVSEQNKYKYPDADLIEYSCISIRDTGYGISEEAKPHLFEPFFTTKPKGKGTGLGLSMVYGAVKQFQGFITVETELGLGSTFKICLPAHKERKEKISLPYTENHVQKGNGELIILVEDDTAVRNTTLAMLKGLSYDTMSYSSGFEALEALKKLDRHIDLLFTDVIMQGMKGNQLYQELKTKYPNLNVLFASGYTDKVIAEYGILYKDTHFIAKPFNLEELSQKIYEILHS